MRIPKYTPQTSVSVGQAYRTGITQQSPTLQQAQLRNPQNYMIDIRAGQADMNAEAAALESKGKAGVTLGEGLAKLGMLMHRADQAAQGGAAWSKFNIVELELLNRAKTTEWEVETTNELGDKLKIPGHEVMFGTYTASAIAQMNEIAATLTDKQSKAEFLAKAGQKIREHGMQVSGWAHTRHIAYGQGRVERDLANAIDLDEVDEISTRDDALAFFNPHELDEKAALEKRRIANQWMQEQMQDWARNSPGRIGDMRHLLRKGYRWINRQVEDEFPITYEQLPTNRTYDDLTEDYKRYAEFFTTEDKQKWLKVSEELEDKLYEHEKRYQEGNVNAIGAAMLKSPKRVPVEITDSVLAVDIKSGDLFHNFETWDTFIDSAVKSDVITHDQGMSLRNTLATALQGPLVSSPLALMRYSGERIYGYTSSKALAVILNDLELTVDDRLNIAARAEQARITINRWDDKNHPAGMEGYEAMRRLRNEYGVAPQESRMFAAFGGGDLTEADKVFMAYEDQRSIIWDQVQMESDPMKRGKLALELVKEHIAERATELNNKKNRQDAGLPSEAQQEAFEAFQKVPENARLKDDDGNFPSIFDIVRMKDGTEKQALLKLYTEEFGFKIPEGYDEKGNSIKDSEEEQEKGGFFSFLPWID